MRAFTVFDVALRSSVSIRNDADRHWRFMHDLVGHGADHQTIDRAHAATTQNNFVARQFVHQRNDLAYRITQLSMESIRDAGAIEHLARSIGLVSRIQHQASLRVRKYFKNAAG